MTPENRFDLVNSGEVDLECGSTTNNLERRKTFRVVGDFLTYAD